MTRETNIEHMDKNNDTGSLPVAPPVSRQGNTLGKPDIVSRITNINEN